MKIRQIGFVFHARNKQTDRHNETNIRFSQLFLQGGEKPQPFVWNAKNSLFLDIMSCYKKNTTWICIREVSDYSVLGRMISYPYWRRFWFFLMMLGKFRHTNTPGLRNSYVLEDPTQVVFYASGNWVRMWSTMYVYKKSPVVIQNAAHLNLNGPRMTGWPQVLSPNSILPRPSSHCLY